MVVDTAAGGGGGGSPGVMSSVFTDCDTAAGVTAAAGLKVMASVLSGSKARTVTNAVSPGASATVAFSMAGFSMAGFSIAGFSIAGAAGLCTAKAGAVMLTRMLLCSWTFSSQFGDAAGVV